MILKLIEMYAIGTQEEMLEKLEENGFSSTQATVSRDIKELRLVKQMDKNGVYRYVEGKSETDEYLSKFTFGRFLGLCREYGCYQVPCRHGECGVRSL